MEKPYRIEDEKDLADTRYRWQYRAGMILMDEYDVLVREQVSETLFSEYMKLSRNKLIIL